MELLSPVGSWDALRAACICGADAVYLGAGAFNARAGAGDFSHDLPETVAYAHARGVKVFVTLNNLVRMDEMDDVIQLLMQIQEAKADAVIVTDLGVIAVMREKFPDLPLHASTQMTVCSVEGVQRLKEWGFERVVLAREVSKAEVRRIAQVGVEVECFAHGALCVCVSGQCLFSSMIGGRSGNRGRCAQPCRLPYTFMGQKGYFLSPKDLMLAQHIVDLKEAGVHAIKIEGRLKRPEYVALATRIYRRAIDGFEITQEDVKELTAVFHRGYFTKGHFMGVEDADFLSHEHPGHGGVHIGCIAMQKGKPIMRCSTTLNEGDILQTRGKHETTFTWMQNGSLPKDLQAGDALYRLTDAAQMVRLQSLYEKDMQISIQGRAVLRVGEEAMFELTCGPNQVRMYGSYVQQAEKRALKNEDVYKQLGKTGGTPFVLSSLDVTIDQGAYLSVSALNELRRRALDALIEKRWTPAKANRSPIAIHKVLPYHGETQLVVTRGDSLPEYAGNIGDLGKEGVRYGDFSLNVMNPQTAAFLFSQGLERVCLSQELNLGQMRDLMQEGGAYEVLAYGRARLMTLHHCPYRAVKKLRGACENCGLEGQCLVDQKGYRFPLQRIVQKKGCLVHVLNALPTSLHKQWEKVKTLRPAAWRLHFTIEALEEQVEITAYYQALLHGETLPLPKGLLKTTAGHMLRGVL